MYWFDSHIHLSTYTSSDREQVIKKATIKKILGRIMAGYDSEDWSKQLQIQLPNTLRSFGLHPWQVLAMSAEQIQCEIQKLTQLLPQADFMGETGLDSFRAKTPEQNELLEKIFIQQLELNKAYGKPLVLHIVKDHGKALSILKSYSYSGLVHGFSGSWEVARDYIDLGYKISIGRGVFHKGYKALKEAVAKIPLDSLLLESDAVGNEGDGPEDAVEIFINVVQAVCEIKNISQEQLQEETFRNIKSLLSKGS